MNIPQAQIAELLRRVQVVYQHLAKAFADLPIPIALPAFGRQDPDRNEGIRATTQRAITLLADQPMDPTLRQLLQNFAQTWIDTTDMLLLLDADYAPDLAADTMAKTEDLARQWLAIRQARDDHR